MEALFKEIINGNTALIAAALLAVFRMHREAMLKMDKWIEVTGRLVTLTEVHAKELEFGEKRFNKIDEDILLLRKSDHDIRNKIHDIRNEMVTHKQIREILETK